MILAAKGKDKKSRKQLKQSFQKKYFFHLLLSIFQQTWGPKMSNNKVDPIKIGFTGSPTLRPTTCGRPVVFQPLGAPNQY
jgi:hypothetical protein